MYSTHKLSNGVRVVLSPLHETKTVTVLVLFGVGSRYEHKKISGISHFVEHLMFKGTEKRPTTLDISKELDSVGAEYNAYTGKDITGYYIKINKEKLPLALDMVSDMLFNSKFDATELEREKKVICEEIHMYQDNPMMYVDNLLEQVMYVPSNLGWDIAGSDESVLGITRDEVVDYFKTHYRSDNVVVGVSGNFGEEGLELVTKYFDKEWASTGMRPAFEKYVKEPQEKKVIIQYKETEQVQLALGFHAYDYSHPDFYALNLLGVILGGNMSSRLFISVRERLGLCYYIRATHQPYQDTGNFYIQSGLDKSRVKEALAVIMDELRKMTADVVTDQELQSAKDYLNGKMALQLEDSESVVSWYVTQEVLTEKMLTPEEKLAKLYAVTTEDIKRVAGDLLKPAQGYLALIGPFKDEQEWEMMLK